MVKNNKFKVSIKIEGEPDIEKYFTSVSDVLTFLELKSYNCLYNLMNKGSDTHRNKMKFNHSSTKHLENVFVEKIDLKSTYAKSDVSKKVIVDKSEYLNRLKSK